MKKITIKIKSVLYSDYWNDEIRFPYWKIYKLNTKNQTTSVEYYPLYKIWKLFT